MAQQQVTRQADLGLPRDFRGVRPARQAAAVAAACLVVGLGLGFAFGQHRPAMHEATVTCVSAIGSIQCDEGADLGDGEFAVPRDVAWTDLEGTFHEGGRPTCLPPSGSAAVGPVGITWTQVEVAGKSFKQVVGVQC